MILMFLLLSCYALGYAIGYWRGCDKALRVAARNSQIAADHFAKHLGDWETVTIHVLRKNAAELYKRAVEGPFWMGWLRKLKKSVKSS